VIKARIRRELAYEKIQKMFDGLRESLQAYESKWRIYHVAEVQKEKTLPPLPSRPDFNKLAKDRGISAGQTGLLPLWEMQSQEIGASLVGRQDPVWHYAYQSLPKFQPRESMDMKGNLYLFWKTDETKDHVPKFDAPGVRERVLRTWKMIHARPLALDEAKKLADSAAKSKKFLKQAFADQPDLRVVMPPAFSWMTFGNVPLGSAPNAARLSNVVGIDYAGDDFMRTVFTLAAGQTGVAMNAPKTIAYVIRVTELTPSDSVLQKQFEVDDFSKYAPVAEGDRQQVLRAWLKEIETSAGFTWERKPDQGGEYVPRGEED
jgi:hypothetical protein